MQIKPHPNHGLYISVLRRIPPEQRLQEAFELSDFTKSLFLHGLRRRYPHLSEDEIRSLYLERVAKCHNRSY